MKAVKSSLNLDLSLRLLHSLRPSLGQGASRRARVGWVRRTNFLSILRECFPVVPHVRTIEALRCQHSLSIAPLAIPRNCS